MYIQTNTEIFLSELSFDVAMRCLSTHRLNLCVSDASQCGCGCFSDLCWFRRRASAAGGEDAGVVLLLAPLPLLPGQHSGLCLWPTAAATVTLPQALGGDRGRGHTLSEEQIFSCAAALRRPPTLTHALTTPTHNTQLLCCANRTFVRSGGIATLHSLLYEPGLYS